MKIVGYSDLLSVQGGQEIAFMVSSQGGGAPYEAEIVRLIHGDARPGTPGFKSQPVKSSIEGRYAGIEQSFDRVRIFGFRSLWISATSTTSP